MWLALCVFLTVSREEWGWRGNGFGSVENFEITQLVFYVWFFWIVLGIV